MITTHPALDALKLVKNAPGHFTYTNHNTTGQDQRDD